MKLFLFALVILFATSCDPIQDTSYQPSPSAIVSAIEEKVFYQLRTKKNLHPFGLGGRGANPIKVLYLAFLYFNEIEIKEARELIIFAGNQLLNEINKNEQIRPYLANYPFKPENIHIEIFLKKPDRSEIGSGKLHVITMQDGEVGYDIQSYKTERLVTIYQESYEEALDKIGNPDFRIF